MKKMILFLLLIPGLAMAAVRVNFTMLLDEKEYAGEFIVGDDAEFAYKYENGVEVTGTVVVDEQAVTFDLEILKPDEILFGPYFIANMGDRARIEVEDADAKTLFTFAIEANRIEDDAQEHA